MASPGSKKGYLYILAGGSLWGTGGVWAKILFSQQLSSNQVVLLRTAIALVALAAFMVLKKRSHLVVQGKDLLLLAAVAFFGISLFSIALFYTIEVATITQAIFLLYTAPVITALMARLFLNELLVKGKIIALACSIIGLVLLTRLYQPDKLDIPTIAIVTGLASAFMYACFSLMGKVALYRYSPWTVQFYTFAFGVLFLIFLTLPGAETFQLRGESWFFLVIMGLVSTFAPFAFFYRGLQMVEASRAAVVATIEPVVASLLGFAVFAERLDPAQAVGAGLILLGAVLVQI
jgi:drug/metabolite transporter (DMT)-like permease